MDAEQRMRYLFERVFSDSLMDELPEYVAEDCRIRAGESIMPMGISGMMQHMLDVKQTYPDLKMTVLRQYSAGDCVITEFIAEGTHRGEWLGMKPTGKKLSFNGINVDRVINGKTVEHSGVMNTFETLFEAGIIRPA